ncbi:MAG: isoprenylcysteine carboxylmethyltransferase family protein [Gammaproteobacteria bacterium]|nr:isoprenylcysteine carboxylmethyltransferase family protein [Gammaproteobacteria bacterium]
MQDSAEKKPLIVPPVYLLLFILGQVAVHKYWPLMQLFDEPFRYVGLLPLVLGVSLAGWGARAFAVAETAIKPMEESTTLVTHGLYRFTRNPMYLGMILVLMGVSVLLGSFSPWLLVPGFILLIRQLFIIREEAMMERIFGDQYREYRSTVRRWL